MNLAVEILQRCDLLARFSEEPGRLTRTFLSPPMHGVHQCLREWMTAAGMDVRIDAIGNVVGHYPGARLDLPTFLIGSHVDTVPNAGRYDGILGVLLGIAAVQALRGQRLPFAVEVIAFSEEEGVRYRTSYLGSRALAGRFPLDWLDRTDAAGVPMGEAIRIFGLDSARIPDASYRDRPLLGYLEAHIEQGPVLEERGLPLGVVTTIIGQSRLWLSFHGQAGHAGCLPMERRRDALVAAAEFIVAAEDQARTGEGLRATVGKIEASPGAPNVVPGSVVLSLDVRHASDGLREQAIAVLLERAAAIASRRGVDFTVERTEQSPSVPMDERLANLLAECVGAAGCPLFRLVSGAGHDAVLLSDLAPVVMLFLRSVGGISHHPDEAVRADDVRLALDVMGRLLDRLAREAS